MLLPLPIAVRGTKYRSEPAPSGVSLSEGKGTTTTAVETTLPGSTAPHPTQPSSTPSRFAAPPVEVGTGTRNGGAEVPQAVLLNAAHKMPPNGKFPGPSSVGTALEAVFVT